MAPNALLVEVQFLADRYHGDHDWPPSPFRLFQALVAGAFGGRWRTEARADKEAAFLWLERQAPPHIAAPHALSGRATTFYVPNNDLDAKNGNPREVEKIRVAKDVTPLLLLEGARLAYAWPFEGDDRHARTLSTLVERLHTLGRGPDAAFARGAVVDWLCAERRLRSLGGTIHRPSARESSPEDPTCPVAGSFESLEARYIGEARRFETEGRMTLFRRAPKALSRTVSYGAPSGRYLFELRAGRGEYRPVEQRRVAELASHVRTFALERLTKAMPAHTGEIKAAFDGPARGRVRILPLPSIGHEHTSPSIRRILVEVPDACPMSAADVTWSLSGQVLPPLTRVDDATGEVFETVMTASEDYRMMDRYGFGAESRRWRSVTPAVIKAERRRGKLGGAARAEGDAAAAATLALAAREQGLPTAGLIVHTRREPFHARGIRAEQFERPPGDDRVAVHAELIFAEPVRGPLVLGEGRHEGLGLFRPVEISSRAVTHARSAPRAQRGEVARFKVHDGPSIADAIEIADVFRRALLAKLGDGCPPEISGRNEDGPVGGDHEHALYLPEDADGDGIIDHVLVTCRRGFRASVRKAMDSVSTLWIAGRPGSSARRWAVSLETVCALTDLPASRLLGRAREWISVTPYMKPRFDRKAPRSFEERVTTYRQQIERECGLRAPNLPVVAIEPLHRDGHFVAPPARGVDASAFVRVRHGRGGHQPDLTGGFFRLTFARPVWGPIALGKHAHFGMGLFEPVGHVQQP